MAKGAGRAQQNLFEAVGQNMLLNMFLTASVSSHSAVCMAVGICGHTFLDQALRPAALGEVKASLNMLPQIPCAS